MAESKPGNLEKIFDFLHAVENLKSTLRYNFTKTGRKESSAEHSWRLALMCSIVADELDLGLERDKVVKMALVHDLPEAIVGDIDAIEITSGRASKEEKGKKELDAMRKIREILPAQTGENIFSLWQEYEDDISREAKFVRALDKIETITQLVEIGHTKWDYPDFIARYPDEAVGEFPELLDMLKILKRKLRAEFEKGNLEWKKEYDVD